MANRSLLGVVVAGAVGGLTNALLCYLGWPEPVRHAGFKWHVLPAGLVHGAALAFVAVEAGRFAAERRVWARWGFAVPVAWVAGYVSWIPLDMSLSGDVGLRALIWPFTGDALAQALWVPFAYFGGVALLLYLWAVHVGNTWGLGLGVGAGSTAGIIGSLWFWILYEYWYFSLIHGVLWGCGVGVALWQRGKCDRGVGEEVSLLTAMCLLTTLK